MIVVQILSGEVTKNQADTLRAAQNKQKKGKNLF